jgi:hypothetical protein
LFFQTQKYAAAQGELHRLRGHNELSRRLHGEHLRVHLDLQSRRGHPARLPAVIELAGAHDTCDELPPSHLSSSQADSLSRSGLPVCPAPKLQRGRPLLAHCRDGGRPSWRPVVGVVLPPLWHQRHRGPAGREHDTADPQLPRSMRFHYRGADMRDRGPEARRTSASYRRTASTNACGSAVGVRFGSRDRPADCRSTKPRRVSSDPAHWTIL